MDPCRIIAVALGWTSFLPRGAEWWGVKEPWCAATRGGIALARRSSYDTSARISVRGERSCSVCCCPVLL